MHVYPQNMPFGYQVQLQLNVSRDHDVIIFSCFYEPTFIATPPVRTM